MIPIEEVANHCTVPSNELEELYIAKRQNEYLRSRLKTSESVLRNAISERIADEREACRFACEGVKAPESCSNVERALWDVAVAECVKAISGRRS